MVAIAVSLLFAAAVAVSEVLATCSSPYTRPSWSDLSSSQKAAYVAAAKKLYDRPTSGQCVDPNTASHRDFTQCHFQYKGDNHGTAYFWPWHRRFIRAYELALQSIDSSVVLPFMDWHQFSQAPHKSDVWNEEYFGPSGDPSNGNCITRGTFGGITVSFKDGQSTVSHCFQRIWNPGPRTMGALYPSEAVMGFLDDDDFWAISKKIEGGPHATVHNMIGGEMSYMYSAADPIFYLHHAYVDRLWWYWQNACPPWAKNFAPSNVGSSSHVLTPYSEHVSDVMSTRDGPLCYTYTNKESDKLLGSCPKPATPSTEAHPSTTSPASSATTSPTASGAESGSGSASGGTTTSNHPSNATTQHATWLQHFIIDLAPGVTKLGRRSDVGVGVFFNSTEIPGLNQTASNNNIVLSDTPVIPVTNTTLNHTILINGTEHPIEKDTTVIPGTNVTVALPVVNGTVALNCVAPAPSDAKLATKYIPEDYEDDYVPRSFTGYIAVYKSPKKTVKTAKEYEAAKEKGDKDVVLVLDKNDNTDQENLRHVTNIPLDYIKMMNLDVATVRYMETYANTLVDVINMTPGYTSPDALKNLCN